MPSPESLPYIREPRAAGMPMPPCVVGLLVASLFTAPAASSARAGDWPQILGPTRSGIAADDETLADRWPADGPREVWRRRVGSGYAGVVVRGGRGYLFHRLDGREVLEAFDPASGKTLWQDEHPTSFRPQVGGGDGPLCTPVAADEAVLSFGAQGVLSCHDPATGAVRWRRETHREFGAPEGYFGAGSTPLVIGDVVIANVGGTRDQTGVVAFSLATGATVWAATREPASYSSPLAVTVDRRTFVVMVTRYQCLLLDPLSGKIHWQFPFGMRGPTVNAAVPVVFKSDDGDTRLLVTASYGIGSVCGPFDKDSFARGWEGTDSLATQYCTPIVIDGHLYAIDGRDDGPPGDFVCIEAATGRVAWRERAFGYGTLLSADGKLVVAKTDGGIVLVRPSPEGLRVLSRARPLSGTLRALPAIASGRLFIRDDSTLVCLEVGNERPNDRSSR